MSKTLSHIDASGKATMVDVGHKEVTERQAIATGSVVFPEPVFQQLKADDFLGKKGSILQTAIIAGIQAAKKTSDLIPLCHPLAIQKIDIDITPRDQNLEITCLVKCSGKTGVEMEALTGVSVAALTIYDMCKALSHDIRIEAIQLDSKSGGKSDFKR